MSVRVINTPMERDMIVISRMYSHNTWLLSRVVESPSVCREISEINVMAVKIRVILLYFNGKTSNLGHRRRHRMMINANM